MATVSDDKRGGGAHHMAKRSPCTVLALTTFLVLARVASVSPHALLLESTPAGDTTVTVPSRLVLRFNGRLETSLSSVMLIGGPRQMRVLLIKNEATPEQH